MGDIASAPTVNSREGPDPLQEVAAHATATSADQVDLREALCNEGASARRPRLPSRWR